MPEIPLPTQRILFRRLRADDVDRLDALDRDEGVMQFLDWESPTPAEQGEIVAGHLRQYEPLPGTEHGEVLYRITRAEWLERAD